MHVFKLSELNEINNTDVGLSHVSQINSQDGRHLCYRKQNKFISLHRVEIET